MKTIRPIYIQRRNGSEKVAGLVFLLIIAFVLVLAGIASAQTIKSGEAVTKASVNKERVEGGEGTLISWNINADAAYPFFLVERSTDQVHYEMVSLVKNTGNINANNYFSATDYNPPVATTYYRVSEIDRKGRISHLFKVTVDNSQTELSQK